VIECVHCHQIGIMSFDGRSHWEVCPSHPARKRIAELEAENAKLSNRVGSLTFDNDLLRRGAADDALTIHTCGEIIDRIKKENGDFRAKNSDLEKEVTRLRALVERGARLSEGVSRWQTTFVLECREALK